MVVVFSAAVFVQVSVQIGEAHVCFAKLGEHGQFALGVRLLFVLNVFQDFEGVVEVFEGFGFVIKQVVHGSQVYQNLLSAKLLEVVLLISPFDAEQGLLIELCSQLKVFVLPQNVCKLIHYSKSVFVQTCNAFKPLFEGLNDRLALDCFVGSEVHINKQEILLIQVLGEIDCFGFRLKRRHDHAGVLGVSDARRVLLVFAVCISQLNKNFCCLKRVITEFSFLKLQRLLQTFTGISEQVYFVLACGETDELVPDVSDVLGVFGSLVLDALDVHHHSLFANSIRNSVPGDGWSCHGKFNTNLLVRHLGGRTESASAPVFKPLYLQ